MKKLITHKKSFLIAFLISMGISFAKIAFGQSMPGCDASFRDITSMVMLPAKVLLNNTAVLEAVNKDYQQYTWDFGDGTSDTGQTVIHHFPKEGKYLVTLKVFSPNIGMLTVICEDKKSQWISVGISNEVCDASFQPKIICTASIPPICAVVGFEATTKGYSSYSWDFGDGSIDTGAIVSHSFAGEGKYLVTLNVAGKECEASSSQLYTQSGLYIPNPDSALCAAKLKLDVNGRTLNIEDQLVRMTLVADGITVQHTWEWGDGTSETSFQKAGHTYAKSGKYKVKVTKTATYNPCYNNPLCKARIIELCTQTYEYDVEIGENGTSCDAAIFHADSGLKVTFYNGLIVDHFENTIIEKYVWDFGDGQSGNGSKVEHRYSQAGTYSVKLTKTIWIDPCPVQPGGIQCKALPYEVCSKTFEKRIQVGTSLCRAGFKIEQKGNRVTVTTDKSHVPIGYAKLDYGDGDVIESSSAFIKGTHTYAKPGTYPICLRIATVPDDILPLVDLLYYCTDTFCDSIIITEDQNLGETTSLSEVQGFSGNNVRIYPNPAQNELNIEVIHSESALTLYIFDAFGRKVKELYDIKSGIHEVDIMQLDNGLYLYTLQDAEKTVKVGKLIVSK